MSLPNLSSLHWLAIVLAFVTFMVLGFLWYSPYLFGNQWRKLKNLSNEAIQNSGSAYAWTSLLSFLNVIIIDILIVWIEVKSVRAGALVGLLLGLVIAYTNYGAVRFGEPKEITKNNKLFIIDTSYFIVGFVIVGAILGYFSGR